MMRYLALFFVGFSMVGGGFAATRLPRSPLRSVLVRILEANQIDFYKVKDLEARDLKGDAFRAHKAFEKSGGRRFPPYTRLVELPIEGHPVKVIWLSYIDDHSLTEAAYAFATGKELASCSAGEFGVCEL